VLGIKVYWYQDELDRALAAARRLSAWFASRPGPAACRPRTSGLAAVTATNDPAVIAGLRSSTGGGGWPWTRPRSRLLPPGGARLRCPGERNGAGQWLRPLRESSDAPVRAVGMGMSRGRGRRGPQGRGTAGCRNWWTGSRIWR